MGVLFKSAWVIASGQRSLSLHVTPLLSFAFTRFLKLTLTLLALLDQLCPQLHKPIVLSVSVEVPAHTNRPP